jgi:hypothetical protein
MNPTAIIFIALLVSNVVTGGLWLNGRTELAEYKTDAAKRTLRQIDNAQDQTRTWQEAHHAATSTYSEAIKAAGDSAVRTAGIRQRMRDERPTAGELSGVAAAALREGLAGAEGDIDRCAGDVDRFSREAADAAAAHGTFERAWPRERSRAERATRPIRNPFEGLKP